MDNTNQTPAAHQSKNEKIEAFLREKYDFRFNTVKSKPEFRKQGNNQLFQPVRKFDLNSFKRRIDTEIGIATSTENIRTILESDFSQRIHPVKQYFQSLPRINPETNGFLQQLAQTVTVANPEKWLGYLQKWLLGVVANAFRMLAVKIIPALF